MRHSHEWSDLLIQAHTAAVACRPLFITGDPSQCSQSYSNCDLVAQRTRRKIGDSEFSVASSVHGIIGVARIFSGVHFKLFPQKVDDLFLVVVFNTQAKTTNLTTPTLQLFPPSKNFLTNIISCFAWPGDALTT